MVETRNNRETRNFASLRTYVVNGGRVEQIGSVYRLSIPPTTESAYVDAQLDDYDKMLPMRFANTPPQRLTLQARFSHPLGQLKGTAGFGFWNHPFGQEGQLLASPCNVWFFHASQESNMRVKPRFAGHGFSAAALNSPPLPTGGGRAGQTLLRGLDRLLHVRSISRMLMAVAQSMVRASERALTHDLTQWHTYELLWETHIARFCVDGHECLRAPAPPPGPLGFVAWIDNYKAIVANGQYQFGYVASTQPQWLELIL